MANDCCFGMMVVGEKENVNEFITMLDYTHPHNICFARIFDIYECSRKTLKDGRTAVRLDGSCAWSVHSCMMEGYGTYYGDHKNDSDNTLTSLQIEGERLQLDIEIFSEEPGMGFTEHYRVINGQVIVYECENYSEYYYDSYDFPNFEDWKKEWNLPDDLTEDDLDEDGYYYEGKVDWDFALA